MNIYERWIDEYESFSPSEDAEVVFDRVLSPPGSLRKAIEEWLGKPGWSFGTIQDHFDEDLDYPALAIGKISHRVECLLPVSVEEPDKILVTFRPLNTPHGILLRFALRAGLRLCLVPVLFDGVVHLLNVRPVFNVTKEFNPCEGGHQ